MKDPAAIDAHLARLLASGAAERAQALAEIEPAGLGNELALAGQSDRVRPHPGRQPVAIRVLHRGIRAVEARQQFHRERRVLPVLEQASIARWIDGGLTGGGAAHLVLEFVDGHTIASFARARKLSLHARGRPRGRCGAPRTDRAS